MTTPFTIRQAIERIIEGDHLSRDEAKAVMAIIMEGEATPAQIASLATAMRMKGETIDEITGFAETMRAKALRVQTNQTNLLDIVGTGGDGRHTFNISTASSIVAAAGGVRIAKHGNRAASSKTGSADVLEALGVNIHLNADNTSRCLDEIGICFMFAQNHHQSFKHVAGPRREIGVRTVFNLLGPLTNPAGADRQLVGVFDRSRTEQLANVLRQLGLARGLVVGSFDGLDEISISAPTTISELKNGEIINYTITPDELGLRTYSLAEVRGGDATRNAEMIRHIFAGERGANRDIVLANTGACFYIAEQCATLQEGVKYAADLIDSGKALEKLEQLITCTGELSHVS